MGTVHPYFGRLSPCIDVSLLLTGLDCAQRNEEPVYIVSTPGRTLTTAYSMLNFSTYMYVLLPYAMYAESPSHGEHTQDSGSPTAALHRQAALTTLPTSLALSGGLYSPKPFGSIVV